MIPTNTAQASQTRGRIVFYARDPGGADAIIALLRAWDEVRATHPEIAGLAGHLTDCELIVKDTAIAAAAQAGVDARPFQDVCETGLDEIQNAARMLKSLSARLLVSATNDIDDPTYLNIWRAARAQGIPIIAVLDDPASLTYRFGKAGTNEVVWPDICLAPDDETKQALVRADPPEPESILVTGDLYLASVVAQSRDVPAASREDIRSSWRVGTDTNVILFASSAFAEMREQGRENVGDEHGLIGDWVSALDKGWWPAETHSTDKAFVIRPHPRDAANKYDSWKRDIPFPVRISAAGQAIEAILAADLITGTSPAMLRTAHALGKPAMSNPHQQTGSRNDV